MNTENPHKDFFLMILATIGLYVALAVLLVIGWVANNHRINDIQSSRVQSCQRTYEGIRDVFKPFFRMPDKQTPKETADQAKFNKTINSLKSGCSHQTREKP